MRIDLGRRAASLGDAIGMIGDVRALGAWARAARRFGRAIGAARRMVETLEAEAAGVEMLRIERRVRLRMGLAGGAESGDGGGFMEAKGIAAIAS
jgi:hypothetical protein